MTHGTDSDPARWGALFSFSGGLSFFFDVRVALPFAAVGFFFLALASSRRI